jgi:predicted nuclease of predicted toxin-antitoxin system
MRLLLDENLPRKPVRLFIPEMEAIAVRQRGWSEKDNGELIGLAPRKLAY